MKRKFISALALLTIIVFAPIGLCIIGIWKLQEWNEGRGNQGTFKEIYETELDLWVDRIGKRLFRDWQR